MTEFFDESKYIEQAQKSGYLGEAQWKILNHIKVGIDKLFSAAEKSYIGIDDRGNLSAAFRGNFSGGKLCLHDEFDPDLRNRDRYPDDIRLSIRKGKKDRWGIQLYYSKQDIFNDDSKEFIEGVCSHKFFVYTENGEAFYEAFYKMEEFFGTTF